MRNNSGSLGPPSLLYSGRRPFDQSDIFSQFDQPGNLRPGFYLRFSQHTPALPSVRAGLAPEDFDSSAVIGVWPAAKRIESQSRPSSDTLIPALSRLRALSIGMIRKESSDLRTAAGTGSLYVKNYRTARG